MVELSGDYEFKAPQELVWGMLLDPDVLAMTIAGCEKLERVDENTFQGRLNIKVGPVQGIFQGKVETTNLHPPTSFHMVVNGSGPAGVVRGEGDMTLENLQSVTRLRYDGNVHISGRIASVGQRVMDSSAKSIVRQSLQNLEKQIQFRLDPEPVAGPDTMIDQPAARPAAPSQTEFMMNVTRDVLEDLIPDPGQRRALVGVGLVVIVLGAVNLFANLVARRVANLLKEK
ncbi:MAG TPA: carbon monoxide dehydrogenase subunit G [Promineifilum sp.]